MTNDVEEAITGIIKEQQASISALTRWLPIRPAA